MLFKVVIRQVKIKVEDYDVDEFVYLQSIWYPFEICLHDFVIDQRKCNFAVNMKAADHFIPLTLSLYFS